MSLFVKIMAKMNHLLDKICALGKSMRILLWLLITFTLLALIGLPTFFGLDIVVNDSLLQVIFFPEDFVYLGPGDEEIELNFLEEVGSIASYFFYSSLMICFLITVTILYKIDRLFKAYANGIVFQQTNVDIFKIIGWLLIALFIFSAICETSFTYCLDFLDNLLVEKTPGTSLPEWDYYTTISMDFTLLLAGIFLVLTSKVMALAVELKNEIDTLI